MSTSRCATGTMHVRRCSGDFPPRIDIRDSFRWNVSGKCLLPVKSVSFPCGRAIESQAHSKSLCFESYHSKQKIPFL